MATKTLGKITRNPVVIGMVGLAGLVSVLAGYRALNQRNVFEELANKTSLTFNREMVRKDDGKIAEVEVLKAEFGDPKNAWVVEYAGGNISRAVPLVRDGEKAKFSLEPYVNVFGYTFGSFKAHLARVEFDIRDEDYFQNYFLALEPRGILQKSKVYGVGGEASPETGKRIIKSLKQNEK